MVIAGSWGEKPQYVTGADDPRSQPLGDPAQATHFDPLPNTLNLSASAAWLKEEQI